VSAPALFQASSTGEVLHGGGRAAVPPPAAVGRFGNGCPGTGGFVPSIGPAGGLPDPGNSAFGVYVVRANGGVPALLLGGSSNSWSPSLGAALPVPLGTYGWPGCALLVDPSPFSSWLVTINVGAGVGFQVANLPIPNLPTLLSGQRLHLQWLVLDPGAGGGLCLSDGLSLLWN
jgi:hypothetical protein